MIEMRTKPAKKNKPLNYYPDIILWLKKDQLKKKPKTTTSRQQLF